MENIKATVKGNILTLEIDLKKDQGPSKSGKNILIATTGGNVQIPGTDSVMAGINIYRPKGK